MKKVSVGQHVSETLALVFHLHVDLPKPFSLIVCRIFKSNSNANYTIQVFNAKWTLSA